MKKRILLLIALLLAAPAARGQTPEPSDGLAARKHRTRNILLVTTDGLRWQEVFGGADETLMNKENGGVDDSKTLQDEFGGDTPEIRRKKLLPFLWNIMAKNGQLYGNANAGSEAKVTNGRNFSYPGYNEIFTGFADPTIDSNEKNNNSNVSVLEWLHGQDEFHRRIAAFGSWDRFPYILNNTRSKIRVVAGWKPLMGRGLSPEERLLSRMVAETPRLWDDCTYDTFTFHAAFEYFKRQRPRVLYIGLGETDEFGHAGKYDRYLHAAHHFDTHLRLLWDTVQSLPDYRGATTLIVTTDHGRGDAPVEWKNHGAKIKGSERIWIGVLGPDTPALGARTNISTVTQSQIAATLAAFLGFDYNAYAPKAAPPIAEMLRRYDRSPGQVLRELWVQNLALIEDVRVELEGGYCAWTGETGAGKSLLLTALGLVLGGKASADLIRSGKTEARAAAVFEIGEPALKADIETVLGGYLEDDQVIITRRFSSQGRSSAQINGLPVTVTTLHKLGERLVDIHGQLEGRALLDPDRQRELLDAYGGLEGCVRAYTTARQGHETIRRKRQALLDSAAARRRERALLEFERDELAAADPRVGEHDELAREAHRLKNSEQIRTAAAAGYSVLYEADHSAQDLLTMVGRSLEALTQAAPELADGASTLKRLAGETREVALMLRDLGQGWDDSPARLEEVETRMALYRRLAARFHCRPDELAMRREAVDANLGELDLNDADLLKLDEPLARGWTALKHAAGELSAARGKVARDFARVIQKRLKPLGLGGSRLTVAIETRELGNDPSAPAPLESGADRVEMLFSANPGEEPRPLRKIASGGELSRLTLAAKTLLAAVDRVPTLVFDEVDSGVGGRLGSALGKALAELARHHQVICVTHLPQMASYADHHWVIRKRILRGRSRTTITPLDKAERIEELAAMLRGDSAAEGTRQEAMAMLLEAQATR